MVRHIEQIEASFSFHLLFLPFVLVLLELALNLRSVFHWFLWAGLHGVPSFGKLLVVRGVPAALLLLQ